MMIMHGLEGKNDVNFVKKTGRSGMLYICIIYYNMSVSNSFRLNKFKFLINVE